MDATGVNPLIAARTPEGVSIYPLGASEPVHSIPGANGFMYSANGKLLVVTKADVVEVYDGPTATTLLASVPEPNVVLTDLSPSGTFLVTCGKPTKGPDGQPPKNLKVWEVGCGSGGGLSPASPTLAVPQKQVNRDHWPAIHWAPGEAALAHAVTNTIHVYTAADGFSVYKKMTVKGVVGIAMCPVGGSTLLAAFSPEAKGAPATAAVYDWAACIGAAGEAQHLVKKSFFRTSGAKLMWNARGTAVLVLAFTDFDVTNQSYYGEQKLHYLPADASKMDLAVTVDLKEGPVHDVQWSPSGSHFAVVAGFIPSKTMLFDDNCKPVYDFGSGPHNTVRWNPFGRFLFIAGFGNLPGDINFFDKKTSGACKPMGSVRSPAVTAEWSPDGRHVLTATVAPRLRVDNAYRVFTYYAEQTQVTPFATLFEAAWVPAVPGTFADRPQSPERLAAGPDKAGAASAPAAGRSSGYVPPHLRSGGGVPGSDAGGARPQFSLAFDPHDAVGRIKANPIAQPPGGIRSARAGGHVPGFELAEPSGGGKAASKNAKKRAAKKKVAGSADGDDGASATSAAVDAATDAAAALSMSEGAAGPTPAAEAPATEDPAKRVRALQKKLRQIAELKEKLAAGGGAPATPEQQAKLDGAGGLEAELKQLQGSA